MRSFVGFLAAITIAAQVSSAAAGEPKTLLLLGQKPDGHPHGAHEYMTGMRVLAKCLEGTPSLKTEIVQADEPWLDGPELLLKADGAVLFLSEGAKWSQADSRRYDALSRLAGRGGALGTLHWGMGSKSADPIAGFLKLFGGCHGGPDRKYKVVDTTVKAADPAAPIARGIESFPVHEEFYYGLKFAQPEGSVKSVAQVNIDGRDETVAWAWERPDGGRSFGFSGLHYHENWKLPQYRRLVAQSVLWSLKLPIPDGGLAVEVPAEVFTLK